MNEFQLKLPRESVLATISLNDHIFKRHEGAWGNCEVTDCLVMRYRIKHGFYPDHARMTATQDEAVLGV
jgi:hypothetical protein